MPNTADAAPTAASAATSIPVRSRGWLPLGTGVAFAAALVAIVLIALVTFYATVGTREASARTKTSMETLEQLQTLLSGLKDAETGQRGFLLTGA